MLTRPADTTPVPTPSPDENELRLGLRRRKVDWDPSSLHCLRPSAVCPFSFAARITRASSHISALVSCNVARPDGA